MPGNFRIDGNKLQFIRDVIHFTSLDGECDCARVGAYTQISGGEVFTITLTIISHQMYVDNTLQKSALISDNFKNAIGNKRDYI